MQLQPNTAPLSFGAVRTMLGISESRLRQLDGELVPARDSYNRRVYEPARVSEAIARRAQRRSQP